MEDRRLVEFYRITICKNGIEVPLQKELMKEREKKKKFLQSLTKKQRSRNRNRNRSINL